MSGLQHPVILFDGVCNLCNASVQFIIKRDPKAIFRFAALQSETGQKLLAEHPQVSADSVLLADRGKIYQQSTAALKIAGRLSGLWPLFYVFMIVPRPLRDAVYNYIAKNRYRWFGKQESCMLPTVDLKSRFL